jgi:acyl carrier protein
MQDASVARSDLVGVISGVLGVPSEAIDNEFSSETCETWDSLKHLTLVLAVEEHFGITFSESEIWSSMSFPALREAVARQLQSKTVST